MQWLHNTVFRGSGSSTPNIAKECTPIEVTQQPVVQQQDMMQLVLSMQRQLDEITAKQQRQLDEITAKQQQEKDIFIQLIEQKDREIARLRRPHEDGISKRRESHATIQSAQRTASVTRKRVGGTKKKEKQQEESKYANNKEWWGAVGDMCKKAIENGEISIPGKGMVDWQSSIPFDEDHVKTAMQRLENATESEEQYILCADSPTRSFKLLIIAMMICQALKCGLNIMVLVHTPACDSVCDMARKLKKLMEDLGLLPDEGGPEFINMSERTTTSRKDSRFLLAQTAKPKVVVGNLDCTRVRTLNEDMDMVAMVDGNHVGKWFFIFDEFHRFFTHTGTDIHAEEVDVNKAHCTKLTETHLKSIVKDARYVMYVSATALEYTQIAWRVHRASGDETMVLKADMEKLAANGFLSLHDMTLLEYPQPNPFPAKTAYGFDVGGRFIYGNNPSEGEEDETQDNTKKRRTNKHVKAMNEDEQNKAVAEYDVSSDMHPWMFEIIETIVHGDVENHVFFVGVNYARTGCGVRLLARYVSKAFPKVQVYFEHGQGNAIQKSGNNSCGIVCDGVMTTYGSLSDMQKDLAADKVWVGFSNLAKYGIRDYRAMVGGVMRHITHIITVGDATKAEENAIQEVGRAMGYNIPKGVVVYDHKSHWDVMLNYKLTADEIHDQPQAFSRKDATWHNLSDPAKGVVASNVGNKKNAQLREMARAANATDEDSENSSSSGMRNNHQLTDAEAQRILLEFFCTDNDDEYRNHGDQLLHAHPVVHEKLHNSSRRLTTQLVNANLLKRHLTKDGWFKTIAWPAGTTNEQ